MTSKICLNATHCLLMLFASSAQAQAQAQLGAEIALFSQLWGTYTPGIVVLPALTSSFQVRATAAT